MHLVKTVSVEITRFFCHNFWKKIPWNQLSGMSPFTGQSKYAKHTFQVLLLNLMERSHFGFVYNYKKISKLTEKIASK